MKKKNKWTDRSLAIGVPVILIVVWELASRAGLINKTILPAPSQIVHAGIVLLQEGVLQKDIGISLLRVVEGYLIGGVLGIIVGILMAVFPKVESALSLITELLRPIPIVAWVPVLILWMGIGESSKVTVIAIGTFWPVLINVIDSIKGVDQKYLEVAQVFVKDKATTLRKVVMPAALPGIFTGLRVAVGTAWVSVIGAEMIASSSGLGYLISYSRELAQPDSMLVGVVSIAIIGLLINKFLNFIQKHAFSWTNDTRK